MAKKNCLNFVKVWNFDKAKKIPIHLFEAGFYLIQRETD